MIDIIKDIVSIYNPWWVENGFQSIKIPHFRRPIFDSMYSDLKTIPQILSITGPRRIGKSTLLLQLIQQLLDDSIPPDLITYYSFDDPALYRNEVSGEAVIEMLMSKATDNKHRGISYLFLDEIQRLSHWELYLKKYYDLQFPVRMVISGSASSPIFKKSRESLLGRVKEDYHLLSFSFREYVLYQLVEKQQFSFSAEAATIYEQGKTLHHYLTQSPEVESASDVSLTVPSRSFQLELSALLKNYMIDGGFPEVWTLPSVQHKAEYLFQNQIEKVIYEDIVLAAEIRIPDTLRRLYISLLVQPCAEVTISRLAAETGIREAQITKFLPLLELTNLIFTLRRFKTSGVGLSRGKFKIYLADLALRNAVLRLNNSLFSDPHLIGLYAENLVYLALKKWKGVIQLNYYRDERHEVDFIAELGVRKYIPIEVKYQNSLTKSDVKSLRWFQKSKDSYQPIVVTKQWEHFGSGTDGVFRIPLPLFLMIVD